MESKGCFRNHHRFGLSGYAMGSWKTPIVKKCYDVIDSYIIEATGHILRQWWFITVNLCIQIDRRRFKWPDTTLHHTTIFLEVTARCGWWRRWNPVISQFKLVKNYLALSIVRSNAFASGAMFSISGSYSRRTVYLKIMNRASCKFTWDFNLFTTICIFTICIYFCHPYLSKDIEFQC